ncbi:hypothetical protein PV773_13235 [Mesorhizobium sp. CC13]|uniref:hypothetical protein n=1 Tax=Mesorhizobium sp. CC13 TaxID=3029194 RepID=UPI003266E8C6
MIRERSFEGKGLRIGRYVRPAFGSRSPGRIGHQSRMKWLALATALIGLSLSSVATAQPRDCVPYGEARVQMTELRQRLSADSPSGELDDWISIADPYQARAAFLAFMPDKQNASPYSRAEFYQLQEVHLLRLASGNYRLIYAANSQTCGFANNSDVPADIAERMLQGAADVQAQQQVQKPTRHPDSGELEALYALTTSANSNMPNYPSDTCVALDSRQGTEPREPLEKGTFNGEPVIYLSHRSVSNPAADLLFHITGPSKYDDFVWADGIMLRERGSLSDVILIANYNACGFDGRVSFPTAKVQEWLDTRPDNRVTFEPGDPMPMTSHQRRELQQFLENPSLLNGKP